MSLPVHVLTSFLRGPAAAPYLLLPGVDTACFSWQRKRRPVATMVDFTGGACYSASVQRISRPQDLRSFLPVDLVLAIVFFGIRCCRS